jgi:inner membrane protein involved in colicin E2 resistance
MVFPLQSENALYDGFEVTGKDHKPIAATIRGGVAEWTEKFGPHERRSYAIKYRSRGTQSWSYALTAGTSQVKDFELDLKTDFRQVDFAPSSVSPTSHTVSADGWSGVWKFKTLLTSAPIGVDLPQELNPGPLAARITFFAPVALLFFFFVVAILAAAKDQTIHPMNYFFFGCAFFAFHLLFSYLVDHLAVVPSFLVASAVSIGLVISYARLFVGWRFALREIGVAQLIYLVLFSFTFFWTGFTGLTVTIGAVVTLFLMMQLTGRKQWSPGEPVLAAPRGCATPYRCARENEAAPALEPSP